MVIPGEFVHRLTCLNHLTSLPSLSSLASTFLPFSLLPLSLSECWGQGGLRSRAGRCRGLAPYRDRGQDGLGVGSGASRRRGHGWREVVSVRARGVTILARFHLFWKGNI